MTSMPAKKTPLRTPLRVLIVEDRPADAELMLYELQRSGYEPAWRRVETEADYLSQLQSAPDIILADHTLPEFGAPRALELLKASALDIPLIVVTGSISEEVAVARLKQGATDYVLKDRLGRAIRTLPARQKEALVLRVYHDHAFAEIGTIMSCSEGTAKANYHHAVDKLRRALVSGEG